MKRRAFILGAGAAAGGALVLRPRDEGGPYPAYFSALNETLRKSGPGRPLVLIDRDRLLENCRKVRARLPAGKAFRVVEKSLSSLPLLEAVMAATGTDRLMVFHQPHLDAVAQALPRSDVLLGKPMPARAARTFYAGLKGAFNPARQLQWLIDSQARLLEYQQLARASGVRMRINVEIDVGLHRGGLREPADLKPLLDVVRADPDHLELAGLMGYDAHVGKIPSIVESREKSFAKACATYRAMQDALFAQEPGLRGKPLAFNGAGSPTLRLHTESSPLSELAAGSCLVKPTDFDLDLLADLEPAAFIAAPVLKALEGSTLPGIEGASRALPWWNPNRQRTYFIYGGLWEARYESPPGLRDNPLYGRSSNQAIVNGSHRVPLRVDDSVFLRPTQSERVLAELGDIAVVSGGKLVDWWPVLSA